MGVLQKLSGLLGLGKEMNIEEYMDADELENVDVLHEAADRYVKPIALNSESDLSVVENELTRGNIILLDGTPIAKQQTKLRNSINELKDWTHKANGDIARIGETRFLLTPAGIKIIKKRKK